MFHECALGNSIQEAQNDGEVWSVEEVEDHFDKYGKFPDGIRVDSSTKFCPRGLDCKLNCPTDGRFKFSYRPKEPKGSFYQRIQTCEKPTCGDPPSTVDYRSPLQKIDLNAHETIIEAWRILFEPISEFNHAERTALYTEISTKLSSDGFKEEGASKSDNLADPLSRYSKFCMHSGLSKSFTINLPKTIQGDIRIRIRGVDEGVMFFHKEPDASRYTKVSKKSGNRVQFHSGSEKVIVWIESIDKGVNLNNKIKGFNEKFGQRAVAPMDTAAIGLSGGQKVLIFQICSMPQGGTEILGFLNEVVDSSISDKIPKSTMKPADALTVFTHDGKVISDMGGHIEELDITGRDSTVIAVQIEMSSRQTSGRRFVVERWSSGNWEPDYFLSGDSGFVFLRLNTERELEGIRIGRRDSQEKVLLKIKADPGKGYKCEKIDRPVSTDDFDLLSIIKRRVEGIGWKPGETNFLGTGNYHNQDALLRDIISFCFKYSLKPPHQTDPLAETADITQWAKGIRGLWTLMQLQYFPSEQAVPMGPLRSYINKLPQFKLENPDPGSQLRYWKSNGNMLEKFRKKEPSLILHTSLIHNDVEKKFPGLVNYEKGRFWVNRKDLSELQNIDSSIREIDLKNNDHPLLVDFSPTAHHWLQTIVSLADENGWNPLEPEEESGLGPSGKLEVISRCYRWAGRPPGDSRPGSTAPYSIMNREWLGKNVVNTRGHKWEFRSKYDTIPTDTVVLPTDGHGERFITLEIKVIKLAMSEIGWNLYLVEKRPDGDSCFLLGHSGGLPRWFPSDCVFNSIYGDSNIPSIFGQYGDKPYFARETLRAFASLNYKKLGVQAVFNDAKDTGGKGVPGSIYGAFNGYDPELDEFYLEPAYKLMDADTLSVAIKSLGHGLWWWVD